MFKISVEINVKTTRTHRGVRSQADTKYVILVDVVTPQPIDIRGAGTSHVLDGLEI